jgi:hypothetical protein
VLLHKPSHRKEEIREEGRNTKVAAAQFTASDGAPAIEAELCRDTHHQRATSIIPIHQSPTDHHRLLHFNQMKEKKLSD